jgi:hypothetical protein
MMWRIALAGVIAVFLLAVASQPKAQFNGCPAGFCGGVATSGGGGYTGPGDVVSGAYAWWGLRAYNAAKAGTKAANICNSGDANCADVNTLSNGNFDVTTAQGSPLNCGGTGGTCTIKVLYDQSGNTNCAGSVACDLNVTAGGASARPTLTFSCVVSLPCMTLSGASGHRVESTGAAATQNQPYTISIVAKRTGSFTTNGGIFYMNGNGGDLETNASTNTWKQYAGSNATFTISDSSPHALQAIFNGASSNVYIDGSSTGTSPGASSFGSSGNVILGDNGGGNSINGWVGEVGVWGSGLSAGNQSAMNSNQHTYWGF